MEALPKDSPSYQLYPDDFYPNGDCYASPFGKTKYWIIGPQDGKRVVLIHGVSTPSIAWQNIAGALTSNGYRVLLYDLYGRGYSEAPNMPSDPNLYILQLALLLQYIRWDRADIVGFSIGGATAAAFSATFLHLVDRSVVFISAAGLMEPPQPGDVQSRHAEPPRPGTELTSIMGELQAQHLPHYTRVMASMLTEGLAHGLRWAYETLGRSDKRVLVIHGMDDKLVPFTESAKIKAHIPHAEVVDIEGAGHYLPVEEGAWQQVADSLVKFLA